MRTSKPYKLPNGCVIHPGCRVRVPAEHIWLIPNSDVQKYGLDLDHNAYSPTSEVIIRKEAIRLDEEHSC